MYHSLLLRLFSLPFAIGSLEQRCAANIHSSKPVTQRLPSAQPACPISQPIICPLDHHQSPHHLSFLLPHLLFLLLFSAALLSPVVLTPISSREPNTRFISSRRCPYCTPSFYCRPSHLASVSIHHTSIHHTPCTLLEHDRDRFPTHSPSSLKTASGCPQTPRLTPGFPLSLPLQTQPKAKHERHQECLRGGH